MADQRVFLFAVEIYLMTFLLQTTQKCLQCKCAIHFKEQRCKKCQRRNQLIIEAYKNGQECVENQEFGHICLNFISQKEWILIQMI